MGKVASDALLGGTQTVELVLGCWSHDQPAFSSVDSLKILYFSKDLRGIFQIGESLEILNVKNPQNDKILLILRETGESWRVHGRRGWDLRDALADF